MKRMMIVFLGTLFVAALYGEVSAAYPDKPIKAIIGQEAGANTDISARAVFQLLEKELGQPIMVINKPGAGGALGMRELYAAKPDGYTIGVDANLNVLKLQGLLPVDHHDFDVLAIPSVGASAVAVPQKSPFKTIKELVEYAKKNPEKLKFSSVAKGGANYTMAKYFEQVAGVRFTIINNPGGASFIATQVGGGHTDLGIAGTAVLKIMKDAGNLRFLGTLSEERVPGFEDIPTLKENGINVVYLTWHVYVAPKGIPKEAVQRLTSALAKVAITPEYKQWCIQQGRIPTPQYLGEAAVKFLDQNLEIQLPILEELGMTKKK